VGTFQRAPLQQIHTHSKQGTQTLVSSDQHSSAVTRSMLLRYAQLLQHSACNDFGAHDAALLAAFRMLFDYV
jgi:hypothetical protein